MFLIALPELQPFCPLNPIRCRFVNRIAGQGPLHIVSIIIAPRPYVLDGNRIVVTKRSDRFTRIDMCDGYIEETNLPRALGLARKQGVKFDIMLTPFFLSRRTFRKSIWWRTMPGAGTSIRRPVRTCPHANNRDDGTAICSAVSAIVVAAT